MEISVSVRNGGFNANALARRVDRWTERAVTGATKYLHRSVQNAIRKSANPSRPGTPPHTRKGALRNAVRSRNSGLQGYVGITPDLGAPAGLSRIASLHEYGAKVPYTGFSLAVGGFGPVERLRNRRRGRRIGDAYSLAPLRTSRQVAAARRNFAAFYGAPVKDVAEYPERSFLRSTLDRAMPYIMRRFFRQ